MGSSLYNSREKQGLLWKLIKEEFIMMDFVMTTLSFMVAMLLASSIMMFIIMQKPVLKWYTKKVMKLSEEINDELLYGDEEDEA